MTKVFFKRCLDVIVASALLLLFAPLMAVVAILIRFESAGPVFFRQKRAGKDGVPFPIWKFRTMVDNAVNHGTGLATFKDDPRVTRVGAWLRNYRVDELPQMFNVMKGEMSVVGPRPLLPDFLDAYSPRERRRMLVKPGVTGWQQVRGGSRNTWEERITLDLWYVDNWSLPVDLKVMLLTVLVVVKADGVYGNDGWRHNGCPTPESSEARRPGMK